MVSGVPSSILRYPYFHQVEGEYMNFDSFTFTNSEDDSRLEFYMQLPENLALMGFDNHSGICPEYLDNWLLWGGDSAINSVQVTCAGKYDLCDNYFTLTKKNS